MSASIAVLITYCNEKRLLSECLESLSSGGRMPDEIIVYDDASDEPASDYVSNFPSVRVIRGDVRLGPSAGRNVLLSSSTCDYVHFHDADDIFLPGWHEYTVGAITSTGPDVVLGQAAVFNRSGFLTQCSVALDLLRRDPDLLKFALYPGFQPVSLTVRRSLAMDAGGYREDLKQAEDFDFHVRCAIQATSFEVVTKAGVAIRKRERSWSSDPVFMGTEYLRACKLLADVVPAEYRLQLAEMAAKSGYNLLDIGELAHGYAGLSLAYAIGRPKFSLFDPAHAAFIRIAGPDLASRLAKIYRCFAPEYARRLLRTLRYGAGN